MATNKKLMKYQEFSPNITAQNDKRNLQRARDDLEAAVAKYCNVLGFPSFAGIPIVDSKRGVVGLEIFAMGETVKNIFNEDLKTTILEAFQVSSIEILAKLKDKKDGKEVDPEQAVGEDVVQLPKPPKPVFNMNSGEAIAYFSQLKSTVAHLDGVKIKRKWPKKKNGVLVEEAIPLPSFDENVESSTLVPIQNFSICSWFLPTLSPNLVTITTPLPSLFPMIMLPRSGKWLIL